MKEASGALRFLVLPPDHGDLCVAGTWPGTVGNIAVDDGRQFRTATPCGELDHPVTIPASGSGQSNEIRLPWFFLISSAGGRIRAPGLRATRCDARSRLRLAMTSQAVAAATINIGGRSFFHSTAPASGHIRLESFQINIVGWFHEIAPIKEGPDEVLQRSMTCEAARCALRKAGLRVTRQRTTALVWLSGHPHTTVDDIGAAVRRELGSISTQAVYDVLSACRTAGLVRCIEPAGHAARYECRVGDNHHHLVCRHCGRIEDVDCLVDKRPCVTPNDNHGFAIDEAEIVFWGQCAECRDRQGPACSTETAIS